MYARLSRPFAVRAVLGVPLLCLAAACGGKAAATPSAEGASAADAPPTAGATAGGDAPAAVAVPAGTGGPDAAQRAPNELGRIPVLEYHLIVPQETNEFTRTPQRLRQDLEELRRRGYVPVNMTDVLDKRIQNLPRGTSPVVLVFDDASASQFRYIDRGGKLAIDPTSAVGILEQFSDQHRDWPRRAVFCMLPAAAAGRSFFGDRGIEGQQTAWRFQKLQFLNKQGYELCNHTLYHARLDRSGDKVQEFIARGDLAIDSAVPGYKVRTFALPLGMWPKQRDLAWAGAWTDPKTQRTVRYRYDAVLEVSGNPNESPYDPAFNPRSVNRQIMFKNALESTLNQLDRPGAGGRYVSDGDPKTVARPGAVAAK
jgi:peptidoglycan/xylan/chitin deacetylase (PgdA/CDA1 family)